MKLWQYTRLDAFMLALSTLQLVCTIWIALHWQSYSVPAKFGSFVLLVFMMTYNIIVISHLFTHTAWFQIDWLNSIASMMNSINIGQSVQIYELKHVRNHHRFNNDQQDENGETKDWSSTYLEGKNNEHVSVFRYAFMGALSSLMNTGRELFSITRLWKLKKQDALHSLLSRGVEGKAYELRQIRLDRMAYFFAICFFVAIDWQWTICCYLPAFYLALAMVNIQNYYEHFGAMPDVKTANSVSHYGRIYNFLTFNDGHHQEHHLRPSEHWSAMPKVRKLYSNELNQVERIISPVPAIVGFLHRKRKKLHTQPKIQQVIEPLMEKVI